MVSTQERKLATERLNKTGCLLKPLLCWTICERKPWNDRAGDFGLWQAFNQFVVQRDLLPLQLFIEQLDRCTRSDRRDRMLVDQLRWTTIAAQQNAEIIEPRYHALQFDPVDQEDCQWRP